ncbi:MAG: hypothetical protein K2J77_00520 [Oscillospiraceae bacterium]|nr:hypothetical protein [Oscillospiraceae bacterium]
MGRKNATRTKRRNLLRKMRNHNKRSGLFNGNVERPVEFIVVWASILAFIVGMWIFLMNLGLNKRDYVRGDLVYEGSYRKNDSVVFTLSGGEYYSSAEFCDLDGIAALKGGEVLSVITAKDDVISINYDNKTLLSLEDSEREDAEGKRAATIIFGLFAGLWLLYVAASVLVMCNAHKMPRWLVVVFVEPSYLTRFQKK